MVLFLVCAACGSNSNPEAPTPGTDAAPVATPDAGTDVQVPDAAHDESTGDAPGVLDATDGSTMDGASVYDAGEASGGDGPLSNVNVMFVTSSTYSPNLGGFAGADHICASAAAGVGLPGTFVAWLSTSTVDAPSRLGSARGWVRTDGMPFADTVGDLTSGHVLYPPEYDEYAEPVGDPYAYTMTGTHGDGTHAAGQTCGDWTSSASGFTALVGSGWGGAFSWTEMWNGYVPVAGSAPVLPCTAMHIYCFQTDHQTPVTATAPAGARTAFVSSTLVSATGGLSAGDAACTKDAMAAGLPGTYKALMGTSTVAPESRLNLTGTPWARVDGVVVTPEAYGSTLSIRADGTPYDHDAWVGSPDSPTNVAAIPSLDSCLDWTSSSSSNNGIAGYVGLSVSYLLVGPPCSDPPKPVLCFQD
jgi:hypothetical protein